jgi:alpha-D-ribose 1-methylphosphonate 5-triphosphate synthase subunit PhnH
MAPTTRLAPTDLVRRGRLSNDESQQVFRTLLDTLARPGRIVALPSSVTDRMPPALVPAAALADVEVSLAVLAEPADDHWADVLISSTGARSVPVVLAQMVVGLRAPSPAELVAMERGDAIAPERGARVSIACRSLTYGPAPGPVSGAVSLTLRGPGVESTRHLIVHGLDADVLRALAEANRSFPAGVDAWLVADDGAVVGIARTTSLTIEPVEALDDHRPGPKEQQPDPEQQRGAR